MTMTRHLLLGSAALIAGVTGAVAADLPTKKAAPVEYVRVCSVHGAGFFYIPGSDTCIKLGGRVRADFIYGTPGAAAGAGYFGDNFLFNAPQALEPGFTRPIEPGGAYNLGPNYNRLYGRDANATGYQVNGRLDVDVRTSTQWGTLRAFFRYDFYVETGRFAGRSPAYASSYTPGSDGNNGLDKAYIQWAGITAGRATSFFDFYANDYLFGSLAGSDHTTNLFAYTASFGSGFSATLSVEDPTVYNGGYAGGSWGFGAVGTENEFTVLPYSIYSEIPQGGTRVPDIVANLRVDQGWGSAQLSGVLHQIRAGYANAAEYYFPLGNEGGFCTVEGVACEAYPDTTWGWALQAGVKVNLPMLAAGDALYLQAAYANGATKYAIGGGALSLGFATGGGFSGIAPDAIAYSNAAFGDNYGAFGWSTDTVTSWSLVAALQHYWSPTLRSQFGVSYAQMNLPEGSAFCEDCFTYNSGVDSFSAAKYGPDDVKSFQAAANLIWSPVAGLDIGAEVGYARVDAGNTPYGFGIYQVSSGNNVSYGNYLLTKSSDDRWYTRFRIQREF